MAAYGAMLLQQQASSPSPLPSSELGPSTSTTSTALDPPLVPLSAE